MNAMRMARRSIFFVGATVSISMLFISTAAATEGTCSWHGGVKCAAGADWDGSAVCVDGWRDSSEHFYSQKACVASLYHCSTATAAQLTQKYKLDELSAFVSSSCAVTQQLLPSTNDSAFESRQKAIDSLSLLSACQTAQGNYNLAETQYSNECYSIGESEYYKSMDDLYKQYQGSLTQNQPTQATCPTNTHITSDKQCFCNNGFTNYHNACILLNDWCALSAGPTYSYNEQTKRCEMPLSKSAPDSLPDAITPKQVEIGVKSETTKPIIKKLDKAAAPSTLAPSIPPSEAQAVAFATTSPQNIVPTTRDEIVKPALMSRIILWLLALFR